MLYSGGFLLKNILKNRIFEFYNTGARLSTARKKELASLLKVRSTPGANVMILKIFSPKTSAKNWRF
jgi:hypothetical protein